MKKIHLFWCGVFVILFVFRVYGVIVSMDYEVLIDGKYNFLTSINYDFGEYPKFLNATVVSKSLKGVPPRYQLSSTTVSKSYIDIYPKLYFYKVKFLQGNVEIIESAVFGENKNVEMSLYIKKGKGTFSTNFFTNHVECFDIPGLLFFISSNGVSNLKNFTVFYSMNFTNVYLTNLTEFDKFGNVSDEFVRFKKVGDLTVVDRFRLKNISVGLFTNVYIEGRLVDLKITKDN